MNNDNYVSEKVRDEVREAIEDRAIWLYLIVKELSEEKKLKELPETLRNFQQRVMTYAA